MITSVPPESPNTEAELLRQGTVLDHFKIMRLLGEGGMGVVYLARDMVLGRKVALKLIHPRRLLSREAVERFVFEARTAARFSHPNIVTVYAVSEHMGQPFVAMEYLRGENLRQRIIEERPPPQEALRIALAVAEALSEAHSRGVVHRDLKPENILIARDGRPRVVDFSLAQALPKKDGSEGRESDFFEAPFEEEAPDSKELWGTPPYMAPEQWLLGEAGPAADVWAFGVVLHELLMGTRPFRNVEKPVAKLAIKVCDSEPVPLGALPAEVSQEVAALLAGCLAKDPLDRPEPKQIVETLAAALSSHRVPRGRPQSPFPGLRSFGEEHASHFFGRDAEVGEFVERLREEPRVAVVGPSGAGKSSFLYAGVIPTLRQRAAWTIFTLRPGRDPFHHLAAQLWQGPRLSQTQSISVADVSELWDAAEKAAEEREKTSRPSFVALKAEQRAIDLEHNPHMLGQRLRELAEEESTRVLLVVDQLEELYTHVPDETTRKQYMEALCRGADDAQDPVRIVLALRDDYLGRLAQGEAAREVLSSVTVLRTPTKRALGHMLTRPLEGTGFSYESETLVHDMIRAVEGEAHCLPLLQFAARALWENRDESSQVLAKDAYKTMGGVEGALAEHADGVLQGMSPEQVAVAKKLLLGLVTAEGTRRVVPLAQLIKGAKEQGPEVLTKLTQARLVSVHRSDVDGESDSDVELVHESLIRSWQRLARWVDESREELRMVAQVEQAAALWHKRGQRIDELWKGKALEEARPMVDHSGTRISDQARAFLDAGLRQRDRAQKKKRLALVFAALFLIGLAVGSSLLALEFSAQEREAHRQRLQAENERSRAESGQAEAQRQGARAAFLQGRNTEASAMLRKSLETEVTPLGRALLWRFGAEPLRWERKVSGNANGLDFSPDGRWLAVASGDSSVYIFGTEDVSVRALRGHKGQVWHVAFSPDGKRLLSVCQAGQARLWDLDGGTSEQLTFSQEQATAADFSASESLIAIGYRDGTVALWDLAGEPRWVTVPEGGKITDLRFSPSGEKLAAIGRQNKLAVIEVGTGSVTATLAPSAAPLRAAAWHHSEHRIYVADRAGLVQLVDIDGGGARAVYDHGGIVNNIALTPGGRYLAFGGQYRAAGIVDLQGDGTEVAPLMGHSGAVIDVAMSPSGEVVATSGVDRAVRLWGVAQAISGYRPRGHEGMVLGVEWSPDGSQLATASYDWTARLWDADSGRQTKVLRGHRSRLSSVGYSHDGKGLATTSADNTAILWDLGTGRQGAALLGHRGQVKQIEFDGTDERIVSSAMDGTIRLWNATDGSALAVYDAKAGRIDSVTWSPDFRHVVAGGGGALCRLWDTKTGLLAGTSPAIEGHIIGVAHHPERDQVAVGVAGGPSVLWDVSAGSTRPIGPKNGSSHWLDFHPDGSRVGLPRADGQGLIVELETGQTVALRGHRGEVNSLRFSPRGDRAVTTSDDGTVRMWDTASGRPLWFTHAFFPSSGLGYFASKGWQALGGSGDGHKAPSSWRRPIEQEGRVAAAWGELSHLCLLGYDGTAELLEPGSDAPIAHLSKTAATTITAWQGGCAVLSDGVALSLGPDGATELAGNATAVAPAGSALALVSGDKVLVLGSSHEVSATHIVGRGAVALHFDDSGSFLLGYGDGSVEVFSSDGTTLSLATENAASSAVTALAFGPSETVLVGYQCGVLALYSLEDGSLIFKTHLHGPVLHLHLRGGHLWAITELEDSLTLDFGVLGAEHCDLLRFLWQQIPVVWHNGRARQAAPPSDHPCSWVLHRRQ